MFYFQKIYILYTQIDQKLHVPFHKITCSNIINFRFLHVLYTQIFRFLHANIRFVHIKLKLKTIEFSPLSAIKTKFKKYRICSKKCN